MKFKEIQSSCKNILKINYWRIANLWQGLHLVKTNGYPDWQNIFKDDWKRWESLRDVVQGSLKVLLATSTGGNIAVNTVESLLAAALTLRGGKVHILLCDHELPACLECTASRFPSQENFARYGPQKDLCKNCFRPARKMYHTLGLKVHCYSELLTNEEKLASHRLAALIPVEEIAHYKLDGMAVGEHALAGTLRFFARGDIEGEPWGDAILRRYFEASLLTIFAVTRLLLRANFACAVFHHGIYVPQGLTGEVCRKENVRVINWNPAYRKKCFIFSHGDTYHHTLMTEPVDKWEHLELTTAKETELMEYLKSRWVGSNDWIWFHEEPQFDLSLITRELGIDFSKPCIGLLTNVVWDAQLHYPANAFPNILDWMMKTIDYFKKRPDLQLLIRIHPAEIRGTLPSRQRMVDEITKVFPVLPDNIIVIPPESHISTYAVMFQCNAIIIYGTKTGVELTSVGIPVIVAGEAWIRNKDITIDASSLDDYLKILDKLPLDHRLDKASVYRARQYAYHFFFRRMIPIEIMEPRQGWPPYTINTKGLNELLPGQSQGLDVICEGILRNVDFIINR